MFKKKYKLLYLSQSNNGSNYILIPPLRLSKATNLTVSFFDNLLENDRCKREYKFRLIMGKEPKKVLDMTGSSVTLPGSTHDTTFYVTLEEGCQVGWQSICRYIPVLNKYDWFRLEYDNERLNAQHLNINY